MKSIDIDVDIKEMKAKNLKRLGIAYSEAEKNGSLRPKDPKKSIK